jgi:hypothetical protein
VAKTSQSQGRLNALYNSNNYQTLMPHQFNLRKEDFFELNVNEKILWTYQPSLIFANAIPASFNFIGINGPNLVPNAQIVTVMFNYLELK